MTVATLRTYLNKDIPKEWNFVHAKQSPLPIEM